ncbi:MAG TPA: ornithine cyclodeaminase family protein [Candidatus Baltobacteraceae bacterium]|nr:ornithine cyclodeaminase family protein [Candidatus Baltobacteraceae bacterium]
MGVLMLGESAVRRLLPVADCIAAMERAFRAASAGDFVQPLRIIAWQPDRRGAVAAMPAYLDGAVGAKLITVFPQNRAEGSESHQGLIALHESQNGRLLAIAHAGAITGIRTAAVSALATKLLANEDARDLALIGSGLQAEEHLRAISAVRNVTRVRVWSRTASHAQQFAERHSTAVVPVLACRSAQEAVAGADVICTVTAATEPVLRGEWLAPGAHVNAVGSSVPPFRELDTAVVMRSRIFVDMRDCVLRESDDVLVPIREGAITESDIAGELTQMLSGQCELRTSRDQITLFKSVGMAIEDLAAVRLVYERAMQSGSAEAVDF